MEEQVEVAVEKAKNTRLMNVRLDDEDWGVLVGLKRVLKLSKSDVVRMVIRQEGRKRGLVK